MCKLALIHNRSDWDSLLCVFAACLSLFGYCIMKLVVFLTFPLFLEVYTHLKRPSMCYYRDPPDLILLIQWIQYQRRDPQTSKNNIFINEALFPVRNNFI